MDEFPTVQDMVDFMKRHVSNLGDVKSEILNDPGDGVPPIFHMHCVMDGSEFLVSIVPTNLDGNE